MKYSLSLPSRLALVAMVAVFSSCDSSSNSSKDETPSPKDTVVTPTGTVVAPVISPSGGTYNVAQTVTLFSSTNGADIYYTTDGSVPTILSTKYTPPVTVSSTLTLNAIAFNSGLSTSSVSSASYTITSGDSNTTIPWNRSIPYGSLTYGGQTYKTVKIGNQTWMAENLNYKAASPDTGHHYYPNNGDSAKKYGRLYSWAALMKLPESCNPEYCAKLVQYMHKGICPTGWHVPSVAEWDTLVSAVGGKATAGTNLKSTSGWDGSGNGTDTYGFRALPGGYLIGSSDFVGRQGLWWTSTETSNNEAMTRELKNFSPFLEGLGGAKPYMLSARCLED